jgi:alkyl hydroperoxide reductase subunit AhpC
VAYKLTCLDFGAVATTELVILAKLQKTFLERNVKLLALSPGTLRTHKRWVKDIEEISKVTVDFPIVVDEDRTISYMYRT